MRRVNHLVFRSSRITPLQRTGDDQHRFDGPQAPIVVVLLGEQLTTECVKCDELSSEQTVVDEALSHQHDLANHGKVRDDHGTRPETKREVMYALDVWKNANSLAKISTDSEAHRSLETKFNKRLIIFFNYLEMQTLLVISDKYSLH